VPVLAHHLADPAKGTGIAMVCTFGDAADVTWWRELGLPTRAVTGDDGRFLARPPAAITSRAGRAAYRQLAGETAVAARKRITALLRSAGDLLGDPEPVRHAVNFYERGSQPLEIITSQQWYLRNGGRDPELARELLGLGREIDWHPAHMRVRYENWVTGLNSDWLVSRQRFFGVPIPVWYPLDAEGQPRYQAPIIPADASLPVDPMADTPPGYDPAQRGQPDREVGVAVALDAGDDRCGERTVGADKSVRGDHQPGRARRLPAARRRDGGGGQAADHRPAALRR